MKKFFRHNRFPAQKDAKWVVKQCKWLNTKYKLVEIANHICA